MKLEERLKLLIGELHIQIALLASKLDEAQAKISELSKPKEAE